MVNKKKPPDKINDHKENDPYMTCKKNNLRNIINYQKIEYDPSFHEVLFDAIDRTNKIVTQTYLFMKLYFLYLFENDKNFPSKYPSYYPKIDKQFINNIMNIITYKNETRGAKGLTNASIQKMREFYENHFKPLLLPEDIICRDNLKQILYYEVSDIIKNMKTNIKEHFMSHLRFFIKVYYQFDKEFDKIKNSKFLTRKEKIEQNKIIYNTWNNIVSDIINVIDYHYLSDVKYHNDIIYFKLLFIPFKNSFKKHSIPYDIKAAPLDYLLQMININRELDKINKKIIVNHQDPEKNPPIYKLFNPFPLRTKIVPSYITLDTVCLIDLFITANYLQYRNKPSNYKDIIWSRFFRTNTRLFRKSRYQFNYMIKTDGIACSILFIKIDKNGNPIDHPFKYDEDANSDPKFQYIENINITKLIKNKQKVYGDPGKNDLINFMKQNTDGTLTYFKYTQRQRNHHTKKKKYNEIENELKEEQIDEKTIQQIESQLANYNSKTCDFNKFKAYAAMKITINRTLFNHYWQLTYRKLRWNKYINTRRNEDLMLNNFENKMGSPTDVIIIVGDWSKSSMKGKEPTITKKLLKLFKNRGYEIYLIDEYNTSQICSHCHQYTKNIEGVNGTIWKLIRCNFCGSIHNRDHNAPKNMMYITNEILKGNERPLIFTIIDEEIINKEIINKEIIEI